jgi:hypothetical protein
MVENTFTDITNRGAPFSAREILKKVYKEHFIS